MERKGLFRPSHCDGSRPIDRLASGGAVVAVEVEGQVCDAMRPLAELSRSQPIPLRLLRRKTAGAGVMRHSAPT